MGTVSVGTEKARSGRVWSLVALCMSEVVGTALLLLFGCMASLPGMSDPKPIPLQSALVFGMTVAAIVQIFGHVSGAHLNPAVTAAAWVFGLVNITTAAMYVVSQFVGATVGYAALVIMTPTHGFFADGLNGLTNGTHAHCATTPGLGVKVTEALIGEFLATSVLILLCCGVWDNRNKAKQDGVPLKFGFTIVALALAEGPYSGCSMNPARSFGPALITGEWGSHWIYWIGPMAAGITMAYLYKFVFDRNQPEPVADQAAIPLNEKATKDSTEALPTV